MICRGVDKDTLVQERHEEMQFSVTVISMCKAEIFQCVCVCEQNEVKMCFVQYLPRTHLYSAAVEALQN